VLVDLFEQIPLPGDLHGDPATRLVFAHVAHRVARVLQQAKRGLRDVRLDETRRASCEVEYVGLLGDLLGDVCRDPLVAVLGLARPDVAFAAQRGGHHLEGWERPALLFVDQLPAHRHPVVLDRQLELAPGVADLARRAYELGIDRSAIPLLPTGHDFPEVRVLAARRLALPAPTRILLARGDTVAAARAGIRHERDVARHPPDISGEIPRALRRQGRVGDRPDDALERPRGTHEQVEHATRAVNLARVHYVAGIIGRLERPERSESLGAQYRWGFSAEVQACGVCSAVVRLRDLDDRQRKGERDVEGE